MSVPDTTTYWLSVGYALSSNDRPLELSVNGEVRPSDDGALHVTAPPYSTLQNHHTAAAQPAEGEARCSAQVVTMDPVEGFAEDGMVHFPRSEAWTDYKRTPNQAIFLEAGDNTLTLRTIGSSGANIDGIHLETALLDLDTATFPVFKFNLDPADDKSGLRGWSCCVQVGEITLFDGSGTMLSGATATNPVGLEPLRPGGFCDNFGTEQVIARRSSGGHRPQSLV